MAANPFNAYTNALGRLPEAYRMPGLGAAFASSLTENSNGSALALMVPNEADPEFIKSIMRNRPLMGREKFAVGYYSGKKDPGWRRLTPDEWFNPEIQKELVEAHEKNGGWGLLDNPLTCVGPLHIDGGYVTIGFKEIYAKEQNINISPSLTRAYNAIINKNIPIGLIPSTHRWWYFPRKPIIQKKSVPPPCLFINEAMINNTTDTKKSMGGKRDHKKSRRARGHKKSRHCNTKRHRK
jgi:hypothetical protein